MAGHPEVCRISKLTEKERFHFLSVAKDHLTNAFKPTRLQLFLSGSIRRIALTPTSLFPSANQLMTVEPGGGDLPVSR
jgi:hypothetical protein